MLPLIGSLLKPVFDIIDKVVPDRQLRDKIKFEIAMMDYRALEQELEARAKIIATEAGSAHWLTSAWRPIIMLLMGAIIANNLIIYPYLRLFWPQAPELNLTPEIWSLLKLGISGYIVGRSAEKCVKYWKENNKT